MEGVLQIRTKDLPYRPKQLKGIALFQVFVPCLVRPNGVVDPTDVRQSVIRTFSTLRGLRPLIRPDKTNIKPCRIEWTKVNNEIPTYPDDIGLVDDAKQERFRELPDYAELETQNYSSHYFTKVGGWPKSCQNGLNFKGYTVQIGSEVKANFMWGDSGIAVLYRIGKKWRIAWDCF